MARTRNVFATLVVALAVMFLSGCVTYDGPTVLVSHGKAGFFQQVFGGSAEYCKVAASEGVTLTEADREAFRRWCATEQDKVIDAFQRGQASSAAGPGPGVAATPRTFTFDFPEVRLDSARPFAGIP